MTSKVALHTCAQRNSYVFGYKCKCVYTHTYTKKREKQPYLLINYRNGKQRGKLTLATGQFGSFLPTLLHETVKPQTKPS